MEREWRVRVRVLRKEMGNDRLGDQLLNASGMQGWEAKGAKNPTASHIRPYLPRVVAMGRHPNGSGLRNGQGFLVGALDSLAPRGSRIHFSPLRVVTLHNRDSTSTMLRDFRVLLMMG